MPHDTGTQTRTAQEAAWWRAWRDLDLSWDGLSRHQGHNGSLQDFWRNEAGRLIEEPGTGRRWTRFHCPFHFGDGSPSPKAQWSATEWAELHGSLRTRLAMGSSEKPALLTGVVLDGLWEAEAEVPDSDGFLYIRADHAYFRSGVDLSRNGMGLADFRNAWFGGKALFEGARAVTAAFEGAQYADRMIQAHTETAVEPVRMMAQRVEPEVEAQSETKPAAWRIVAGVLVCAAIVAIAWVLSRNA